MSRSEPLDFRKEDVERLTKLWASSASISIVGIGSAGKTNLLQHLLSHPVQAHYLGSNSPIKPVLVDANLLGPLPHRDAPEAEAVRCWVGYELMMHRLFLAFYPFDLLEQQEAQRFYDAYQALQDGTNPLYAYMALRYFELGLEFLMRRGVHLIFIFDEFEQMLLELPVRFFQTLRGLRDIHKTQLAYMTFTRSPLPTLVDRLALPALDMEPFIELFTDHVHYLGPYNEVDGRRMLERLAHRRGKPHSEALNDLLLQATGRYAGLLRAGYMALDDGRAGAEPASLQALTELLIAKPAVRAECKTIWAGLNRSERYVLKAVARLTPYHISAETEQAVAMLIQKRLLRLTRSEQRLEIEPPLFRAYVATDPDPDIYD
ncbi:MAG: hypothetical protein SNJ59_00135 [Aggregatilineales bacterium]